ncbi:MAG: TIM barrel protein, partial [Deltaproteobacteria bacterium]|nr:TIM barrel protein [Deltaproteobacteria bacterium]
MLIGIHTSIGDGYDRAIEEGEKEGAEAVQIFVRQNLTWNKRAVTDEEAERFKRRLSDSALIKQVIAHSSYLINLASDNKTTLKRSVSLLSDEIQICEKLGID